MISTSPKTLSCTVHKCVYPRDPFASGTPQYCIMLTSVGRCVGRLPFFPANGMRLRLHGRHEEKQGRLQFRFDKVEHDAPKDSFALLEYVATLTKGVGEKAVEKIWAAHGEEWRAHLDELPPSQSTPIRLTLDRLCANEARMDLLRWILANGGTPKMADAAFDKWGSQAAGFVEANPYSLCELDGIGFKTADKVAEKRGIGKRDMRRAVAAIDYCANELMGGGDSAVHRDDLYAAAAELSVSGDAAALAVVRMARVGRIHYVGEDLVTTGAVVRHEGGIAQYICGTKRRQIDLPVPAFYTDAQARAICNAFGTHGVSVVNGGAGTGKTTVIKEIADQFMRNGERVELCAFAGKAAARVREATGLPAHTIHSMLGYTGEGCGFRTGNLEGVSVIVDEASMVSSSLMYEICRRNPKRLVLVGDQAQLPPVGIGSPFHDVVDMMPTLVTTLDKCHRASGAVLAAGEDVRGGRMPSNMVRGGERFSLVYSKGAAEAHADVIEAVKGGEIDFAQDAIIVPRNGEGEDAAPCSVKSLNDEIQSIVNPHDGKFGVGDRVMCVKNFPKDDIWNGTCGWISRIDCDGVPYFAPDGGAEVRLMKEQREAIVPAWAITIHKAQGSQYRKVLVACLARDAVLMDRAMLYTAITRAKETCVVYCDNGIERAVNDVRERKTYLKLMMKGEA